MANISKNKAVGPSMADLLDNVLLAERKREIAKAHIRDAELLVDLVSRGVSAIVSAVAGIEHSLGTLASRAKSSFDKLAHH